MLTVGEKKRITLLLSQLVFLQAESDSRVPLRLGCILSFQASRKLVFSLMNSELAKRMCFSHRKTVIGISPISSLGTLSLYSLQEDAQWYPHTLCDCQWCRPWNLRDPDHLQWAINTPIYSSGGSCLYRRMNLPISSFPAFLSPVLQPGWRRPGRGWVGGGGDGAKVLRA